MLPLSLVFRSVWCFGRPFGTSRSDIFRFVFFFFIFSKKNKKKTTTTKIDTLNERARDKQKVVSFLKRGRKRIKVPHFLSACVLVSLCARARVEVFSSSIMGALKRLKKKLTRGGKGGKTFDGAPKARVALGDATNVHVTARDFGKEEGEKTHDVVVVRTPGKKKTATKPFRTADVTTNSALDDTTTTTTRGGAARFTAVEIFEDEDRGVSTPSIDSPELKAPPPSSASSSFSSPKSSSKSALDAWADALVGRGDEEVKEEKVAGTTPTKNDFEVEEDRLGAFSSDANNVDVVAESPIVSYELSDSECDSPMCVAEERVLGNVESVNDETEDGVEDALESYLFTPPAVPTKTTNIERVDKETPEEKKNTQSARLSSSMWDINSTKKKVDMSFMKNASAMDVAMGAGVAAVVFNFFMPSFLKASF